MVEAAVREQDRCTLGIYEPQARFSIDAADARDGHTCTLARGNHSVARIGRRSEAKFVVVAARQRALQLKRGGLRRKRG